MKQLFLNLKQIIRILSVMSLVCLIFMACDELLDDEDDNLLPFQQDQYEPNDSQGEAAQIELATDIVATIFPKGDVDYYRVTPVNTGVWNRVEFSLSNVSEDLRVSMGIYDENGERLSSSYASNTGAGLELNIETLGGNYFVKVESFHTGGVGAYTLNVKNLDNNDVYAPNDNREQAYDLGILPSEGINGIIAAQEEEDWFKIQTENDGFWDYIEFELTDVSSDLRAQMFIYNDAGTRLTAPYAANGGQSLKYTLATPGGIYYIGIKRFTGTLDAGEYTLNVRNLHANDQYAPNDSRDAAYDLGLLPLNDLQGKIILGGEQDWYKFTTINDNPVVINVTNVGSNLRPQIQLHDGTVSSTFTSGGTGSNIMDYSFAGVGSPSQPIVEGKTYYFRVSGFTNSSRGEYNLSIVQYN